MNQMEVKRKRYTAISIMIMVTNLLVLSGILGEHGIGYLAGAFECFLLLIFLTVYTMPEAMAKLIRVRMQKGQGRNAMRVLKAALFVGVIYAVIGTLFLGVFAELILGKLLENTYGAFTMRLFIPAYILFVFVQAFRGFFQGMGSAVPTGISKIVEKIVLFGTSILFCFIFESYGDKVSALLQNEEFSASFSSAGVAVGFAAAELFALLFLLFVYQTNKRRLRAGGNKDSFRMSERLSEIIYILVMTMLPLMLYAFLGRITVLGGMALYQHSSEIAVEVGIGVCGAFYGKYLTIVLLLVMILRLVVFALEGQIQAAYRKDEYRAGREKISWGAHFIIMLGSFFAVLMAVLGETLMKALYAADSGQAGDMLRVGSTLIVFMALGMYFMQILLGQGKIKGVLINLVLGLAVFFLFAGISTGIGHVGMDGIVIGHCISWFVITCGSGFLCIRSLKWMPEWIYMLAVPVGCSALTGIIMMLLNKALVSLTGEALSFLICLIVGLLGNFILLMALRGIRREEFEAIPCGRILCKIAEIIHLL